MLGTNRDLHRIRRMLDSEIAALRLVAAIAPEDDRTSQRLDLLARQRLSISAVLANRRIEAAKKVVVLSRWLSGNGLLGSAPNLTQ
jgi:hypothetical protein